MPRLVYSNPCGKKCSLRLGDSNGGSERWLDSRCVLRVKTTHITEIESGTEEKGRNPE